MPIALADHVEDRAAPQALAEARGPQAAVRIRRPIKALQSWVTFFYVVEVAEPVVDFLYPEWGNVRFLLNGAASVETAHAEEPVSYEGSLYGPTDKPSLIRAGVGKAIGFGLTPLAWHRLVGGDASGTANAIAPLGALLGEDNQSLARALRGASSDAARVERLEAALVRLSLDVADIDPRILAVDRALRSRPATVADFAAAAGIGERTLSRECCKIFGFTPKRLIRLQRFLDTLGRVRSGVRQSVRASLGDSYVDEPHFYHDFRDFMGMSPRSYFAAPRPIMGPATQAQTAAGVTLSFRLPPQPGE